MGAQNHRLTTRYAALTTTSAAIITRTASSAKVTYCSRSIDTGLRVQPVFVARSSSSSSPTLRLR